MGVRLVKFDYLFLLFFFVNSQFNKSMNSFPFEEGKLDE